MFDITYTATWDGNYLTIVAVVRVAGDSRLRSHQRLKPTVCKSEAQAHRLLAKNKFYTEEVVRNDPFEVRPMERIQ